MKVYESNFLSPQALANAERHTKKDSGDCTTVATQPRQLHYSNNLSKKEKRVTTRFFVKKMVSSFHVPFFLVTLWEGFGNPAECSVPASQRRFALSTSQFFPPSSTQDKLPLFIFLPHLMKKKELFSFYKKLCDNEYDKVTEHERLRIIL